MGWFNSLIISSTVAISTIVGFNSLSPRPDSEPYDYELHVFGADSCPPCRRMDREVWQSLSDPLKYKDEQHKVMELFLKQHNIEFHKHMWNKRTDPFKKYKINKVPTILLIQGEEVILSTRGYKSKEQVKKLIQTKIKGQNNE